MTTPAGPWSKFLDYFNVGNTQFIARSSPRPTAPICFRVTASTPEYPASDVGGKAHNCIKLVRMGVNVPRTFVVSCGEYETGAVTEETKTHLRAFLSAGVKYAVRSSASVEDGADSAFAGRFLTELNVPGTVEAIAQAIVKCWGSMNAPDLADKLKGLNARMGVVVMEQIDSARSGVLFQANPITQSRATYVITAGFGQGEGVVGGHVAIDTYTLRSSTLKIRNKDVPNKETMITLGETGTKTVPVPEELRKTQCLSDLEIIHVAKTGKIIRNRCASPQDVEFAFDAAGVLFVLQTRPITTLSETLTWVQPNVGLWQLNGHLPTPMSKFYSPCWQAGHARGAQRLCDIVGAGFNKIETTDINGFAYFCMRQPGPKSPPKALPPPFVLRMILRLTAQPAIKEARKFWIGKAWRSFKTDTFPDLKKSWLGKHNEMISRLENSHNISDKEFSHLVADAQEFGKFMYGEHAWVTFFNLAPIAWFVILAKRHTECSSVDAFSCVEAFSSIAMGFVGEFPEEIKLVSDDQALVDEISKQSLVKDVAVAKAKTEEIVKANFGSTPSRKALQTIVNVIKYRLSEGYDSANGTLMETPSLIFAGLVDSVHKHRDGTVAKIRAGGEVAGKALIEKCKTPEQKKELEEWLEEARSVASLRDERAMLTDLTANGIIHHILLEAGRRLVVRDDSSKVFDSSLMLLASKEEICSALESPGVVPASFWMDMQARKKYRAEASVLDAPLYIGGVNLKPTEEYFSDPFQGRSAVSVIFVLDEIFRAVDFEEEESGAKSLQNDPKTIVGTPGSANMVTGKVRLLMCADDAALVEMGDIIVTKYPSSLINLVLNRAGGIVSDLGGVLCHAAICARECSIPAVVGCHTATMRLKNGDMVEVDGTNGTVKLI